MHLYETQGIILSKPCTEKAAGKARPASAAGAGHCLPSAHRMSPVSKMWQEWYEPVATPSTLGVPATSRMPGTRERSGEAVAPANSVAQKGIGISMAGLYKTSDTLTMIFTGSSEIKHQLCHAQNTTTTHLAALLCCHLKGQGMAFVLAQWWLMIGSK